MPKTHRLDAGAETVHWGYFDAKLKPLLTIDSGDTVTISTVSGGREVMPPPPLVVPEALAAVQARVPPKLPGHICTGPVAIRGRQGRPGARRCASRRSSSTTTGATISRVPSRARCPTTSPSAISCTSRSTGKSMTGRLPWGLELPLRPFFGVMAVAPPAAWGSVSTLPPRKQRRQPRQQGAGGGHHALSADPRRRRAVLGRRRPRRAGRRRGVRDGHRDRADRHLRAASCARTCASSGRGPRRRRTS